MGLKATILATAALLAVASLEAQAATTFYTDRAAFEAATQPLTVEDFANGAFAPGLSVTTSDGRRLGGAGVWRDRPTPAGATTTWSFATAVTAFGADFDLSPAGSGTGLRFTLDGTQELATQLWEIAPSFFGFITDSPFSSVRISSGDLSVFGIAETHNMDNLSFGDALVVPSTVPLPAGLPLLLAALGGFAVLRRGRMAG